MQISVGLLNSNRAVSNCCGDCYIREYYCRSDLTHVTCRASDPNDLGQLTPCKVLNHYFSNIAIYQSKLTIKSIEVLATFQATAGYVSSYNNSYSSDTFYNHDKVL